MLFVVPGIILLAAILCASSISKADGLKLNPSLNGIGSSAPKTLYPDWWGESPAEFTRIPCPDSGSCVKCHPQNSGMDERHAFSCEICHKGNIRAFEKDRAHDGLIGDPGDLDHVGQTCGKCHPREAYNVQHSPMALAPKLINHTRYAFGSQDTAGPLFGVRGLSGLRQIPLPKLEFPSSDVAEKTSSTVPNVSTTTKAVLGNLGDDLLRRSCLRCHLNTKGSQRPGEQRGKGCSACHIPYSNADSKRPYSHVIVKNLGVTPCLKCHNSNHVGCDYVGLFEKDFNRGFRSPIINGRQAPTIYGSEQHFLRADIHFRAGMICADCHTLGQIHGTGHAINSDKIPEISCESCHVNLDHPLILKDSDGKMVLKRRPDIKVPALRIDITPHRIEQHRKLLTCSACHAAWSFQDYGYHLMLDERAEYWMWSINAASNDPQTQEILHKFVGDYAELVPPRGVFKPPMDEKDWEPPKTKDWLNGQTRLGAWFKGFTMRRWSDPPLGLATSGKVTVMRPMRQYAVSWVKSDGTVMLDSVIPTTGSGKPALIMDPYAPHTIQETGRPCHSCHGNPKALGLGQVLIGSAKFSVKPVLSPETGLSATTFRWDALLNEKGEPLQSSSFPEAGPLSPTLFRKLMFPGAGFRLIWSQYLSGSK